MDQNLPDWSQLPKDLIEQIAKHLKASTDHIRFRSVCTTWRSSVPPKRHRTITIVPNHGITNASLGFGFSLSKRTLFLLKSIDRGNPFGWIVKIDQNSFQRKRLLNPVSKDKLKLSSFVVPSVLDLRNVRVCELGFEFVLNYVDYRLNTNVSNLYMEKVVVIWLSSDEKDYVLLTIHVSGKLTMFKSGSESWVVSNDMPSPYDDVIVYKGRFFAVDNTGRCVVVGLDMEIELVAEPVFGGDKKYLVESEGELLLVDMYLSVDTEEGDWGIGDEFLEHLVQYMSERTVKFEVFKLDEAEKCWIPVRNLGDRMLFLGDNSTFSASASDFFECKGNCIFFMDNNGFDWIDFSNGEQGGGFADYNIGVFELETGSMGHLENYPEYSKMFWPPPRWVASTSSEVQTRNQIGESSRQQ